MKTKRALREVLKVLLFLVLFLSLIGFSNLNPIQNTRSIYYPMINHLLPVSEDLKNQLVISEIMFNPEGSEPGGEWIEIFNRSSSVIDLNGYKIGDSELRGDLEGMYAFPDGFYIHAGQTILIANQSLSFAQVYKFKPNFELTNSDPETVDLIKFRKWSGGVINLNNSGDELLLINQADNLVDAVSWGNSNFAFNPPAPNTGDGESLERNPANSDGNRADDWSIPPEPGPGTVNLGLPTSIPQTPTAIQPLCDNNTILISEVFYDPAMSPEPDGEWMELYNYGDTEIELGCLLLGDEETVGGAEGMMEFPSGSSLSPREVIVIANRSNTFLENYGMSADFEINDSNEGVPDLVSSPQWAVGKINLSNSADELSLIKQDGQLIDAVSWGGSIFAFNPAVPIVNPGHSISRQPADADTDSAEDWLELIEPNPGIVLHTHSTPSPSPTTDTPTPKPPSPTTTLTPTPASTNTPTPTSTSTQTGTPEPIIDIVINEILADPDDDLGDANNDGDVDYEDDEFLEFVNSSASPMDISSWAVGDALEIRHIFPDGSWVEPNCGIVLFGGGNPTGNFGNSLTQVASSGKLGLNGSRDTIYLYNSQLEIVISLSYGEEAGDNQSITRDPDILGALPLRKHSLATGSDGTLFSPGTQINGDNFSGCPE